DIPTMTAANNARLPPTIHTDRDDPGLTNPAIPSPPPSPEWGRFYTRSVVVWFAFEQKQRYKNAHTLRHGIHWHPHDIPPHIVTANDDGFPGSHRGQWHQHVGAGIAVDLCVPNGADAAHLRPRHHRGEQRCAESAAAWLWRTHSAQAHE